MNRVPHHQRIPELERVLGELNTRIQASFDGEGGGNGPPDLPVLLLVGNARSGGTLFLQWLAASGQLAYPTNLASRFFGNARVAGLVQRALIDLDARFEIFPEGEREIRFRSELGKTFGAAQPHEFWYFWRRFFRFGDINAFTDAERDAVDVAGFLGELGGFQRAFGKPLALKATIVNWHVGWLANQLPTAIVIHLERDPVDNALSLLRARETFYGDRAAWYSFKPPEYPQIVELDPLDQVLEQVRVTNAAIESQRAEVPASRWLHVRFDDFCADPGATWSRIQSACEALGASLPGFDVGCVPFPRRPRDGGPDRDELAARYRPAPP